MATGVHHYDALTGIKTVIEGLALTGITGATPLPANQVYIRKLPTDENLTLPAVVVSLVPRPEIEDGGLNASADYGYPCCVTIIVPNNQALTVDQYELSWRQQIRNAFNYKKPSALVAAMSATIKHCRWEPMNVLDLTLFHTENLFVSAAIIRVFTRETL